MARRAVRSTMLAVATLFAFASLVPATLDPVVAHAAEADEEKPKKSVAPEDVYYGDAKKWDKPAEVDPDAVYAQIEEYKQILAEGLKPSDPKYSILMSKASRKFCSAVKKTAKDGGYDLVARLGSVKGVDSVPNITSDVIGAL